MAKYVIENNINFFNELNNNFELNNNDIINECYITGTPLVEGFVTLQCGHTFNYDSLMNDICVNYTNAKKIMNCGISCPYCRASHFTTIPYYDKSKYPKMFRINSNDINDDDYSIDGGLPYVTGKCSDVTRECACTNTWITAFLDTDKHYCHRHYNYYKKKYVLNVHKSNVKLAKLAEKKEKKEEIKKLKLLEKTKSNK